MITVGSRAALPSRIALAAVVVDHQLEHRLGHPVRRRRLHQRVVVHGIATRRTEDGQRAGRGQAYRMRVGAAGLQQVPGTVQVDPQREIEVPLPHPAHHRGQVEHRDRTVAEQRRGH